MISNDQIEAIALANGFKLKEQPDGSLALNPYVYDFARALLAANAQLAADVPNPLFIPLRPNCRCYTAEAERRCMLNRMCTKTEAH